MPDPDDLQRAPVFRQYVFFHAGPLVALLRLTMPTELGREDTSFSCSFSASSMVRT